MIAALIVSVPLWLILLALRDLNQSIKSIEKQDASDFNL
jgi:hypothetical protein